MREAGYFEYADRESDRKVRGATWQCIHCGCHYVVSPGSGRRRGWCLACNGATCGKDGCDVCVHMMQRIENCEAGMTWAQASRHKPIKASLAGLDVPRAHTAGGILLSSGD